MDNSYPTEPLQIGQQEEISDNIGQTIDDQEISPIRTTHHLNQQVNSGLSGVFSVNSVADNQKQQTEQFDALQTSQHAEPNYGLLEPDDLSVSNKPGNSLNTDHQNRYPGLAPLNSNNLPTSVVISVRINLMLSIFICIRTQLFHIVKREK